MFLVFQILEQTVYFLRDEDETVPTERNVPKRCSNAEMIQSDLIPLLYNMVPCGLRNSLRRAGQIARTGIPRQGVIRSSTSIKGLSRVMAETQFVEFQQVPKSMSNHLDMDNLYSRLIRP